MPLADRACPVCLTVFEPKRIDQLFDQRSCRDERYGEEYESLFYVFPLALKDQGFACFFCAESLPDTKLWPLKLNGSDQWVAACKACKLEHYGSAVTIAAAAKCSG